jgi:ferredoxin
MLASCHFLFFGFSIYLHKEKIMTHVITSLCVRDRGCIEVCPVECIVPGQPVAEWPMMYIDPDTCIDCGACVPECPFAAIFPEDEVPSAYTAKGGEYINKVGLNGHFEGSNHHGKAVVLETARQLVAGETVDLTPDIKVNNDFFKAGPGYSAKDNDQGV